MTRGTKPLGHLALSCTGISCAGTRVPLLCDIVFATTNRTICRGAEGPAWPQHAETQAWGPETDLEHQKRLVGCRKAHLVGGLQRHHAASESRAPIVLQKALHPDKIPRGGFTTLLCAGKIPALPSLRVLLSV